MLLVAVIVVATIIVRIMLFQLSEETAGCVITKQKRVRTTIASQLNYYCYYYDLIAAIDQLKNLLLKWHLLESWSCSRRDWSAGHYDQPDYD